MTKTPSFVARFAPNRSGGTTAPPPHADPAAHPMTAFERLVSTSGHNVHKLKAKDSTGRWAIYYVYVPPIREKAFLRAIGGDGMADLQEFGQVIGSCYGEAPTPELVAELWRRFRLRV
jgi:hypothetical protein